MPSFKKKSCILMVSKTLFIRQCISVLVLEYFLYVNHKRKCFVHTCVRLTVCCDEYSAHAYIFESYAQTLSSQNTNATAYQRLVSIRGTMNIMFKLVFILFMLCEYLTTSSDQRFIFAVMLMMELLCAVDMFALFVAVQFSFSCFNNNTILCKL